MQLLQKSRSAPSLLVALDVSTSKVGFAHTQPFTLGGDDDDLLPLAFPHSTLSRRTRNAADTKWLYSDREVFSLLQSLPNSVISDSDSDSFSSSPVSCHYILGYPHLPAGASSPSSHQGSVVLSFLESASLSGSFHPSPLGPLPSSWRHGSVSLWDESFSTLEAYGDAVDARLGGKTSRAGNKRTGGTNRQSEAAKAADRLKKEGKEDAVAAAIVLRRVLDEMRRVEEGEF